MADRSNPWWVRLFGAAAAAWLAALLVSGSVLWISFIAYNPWYHPARDRMDWQPTVLSGVFGNIAEHGLYAFVILLVVPLWLLGVGSRRRLRSRQAILFGVMVGLAAGTLVLAFTPFGLHAQSCGGLPGDCVVWLRRILVPTELYAFAAFALPIAASVGFVLIDSALLKMPNSAGVKISMEKDQK